MGFHIGGLIAIDYSMRYKNNIQGVIGVSPLLVPTNHTGIMATVGSALSAIWPSFSIENQVNVNDWSRDDDSVVELKNDPLIHSSGSVKLNSEVRKSKKILSRKLY